MKYIILNQYNAGTVETRYLPRTYKYVEISECRHKRRQRNAGITLLFTYNQYETEKIERSKHAVWINKHRVFI